mmetsp:Transcript_6020/g.20585  ORF Transcript_6020/g.20585 Transcript_6020/m.20585 type:complete len:288 (-) Transcript_6020:1009-1872(-)
MGQGAPPCRSTPSWKQIYSFGIGSTQLPPRAPQHALQPQPQRFFDLPHMNPAPGAYPSRWRGAHFMMSSTRRIISAASVAERSTCCFTRKHSLIPSAFMSPTAPVMTSTPARLVGSACAARKLLTRSALSRPALSEMMVGIWRRARAYASMARDFLPGVEEAASSMTLLICISGYPPPYTTRLSLTVLCSTQRASCSERSASSSRWVEAPRSTMVQASPFSTPEKWMSLSSPIMISSISLHVPSLTSSGRSNVLVMSPPRTRERRSMPSKSACSIAMTPASVKSCSG